MTRILAGLATRALAGQGTGIDFLSAGPLAVHDHIVFDYHFPIRGGRAVCTAGKVGANGREIPQGGPPPASNAGAVPASAAPAWGTGVPMPVRAQAGRAAQPR